MGQWAGLPLLSSRRGLGALGPFYLSKRVCVWGNHLVVVKALFYGLTALVSQGMLFVCVCGTQRVPNPEKCGQSQVCEYHPPGPNT